MAAKAQTLSNSLLDAVLRNVAYTSPAAVYAALYTVTPTPSTAGTEVTTSGGTLYNRVSATFSAAAAGATSNSGAVTFPVAGASWGTVVGAAITDNATPGAGNVLYFGNLGTPKTVGTGDQLTFAISALSVTES
jgi:hypothetical protein